MARKICVTQTSYGFAGLALVGTYSGHDGPISRYDLMGTPFIPEQKPAPMSFQLKVADPSSYPSCSNGAAWADMKTFVSLTPAEEIVTVCDADYKKTFASVATPAYLSHAAVYASLAFLLMHAVSTQ